MSKLLQLRKIIFEKHGWAALTVIGLLVAIGCGNQAKPKAKVQKGEIVKRYPHDAQAFTQGLVFHDGKLIEGTGQYGHSELRVLELESGKVLESMTLDQQFFGEGITILDGKIYQLTWKNNVCFIYDLATLKFEKSMQYVYEGWGLTNNGKELILSDGSFKLRFLDPNTLQELRSVDVMDNLVRIKQLNELEWVDGEIWANVWYEDRIARIAPETGKVLGWIDLSHLYPQSKRDREAVLNGIAYDKTSKRIFITGKNWPALFEVKVNKR